MTNANFLNRKPYWEPIFWVHATIFSLIFLTLMLWTILKIAELKLRGIFRFSKLSNFVLVLLLCAFIVKLAAIFFDYSRLFIFDNTRIETLWAQVVLRVIPISLWLAASSLILGFWFDVLKKKLLPTMAHRTKVVCICGASLMLLQIPGFALLGYRPLVVIAGLLIIIPYLVNIIGIVVISIQISKKSNKSLSSRNATKKSFAMKRLIFIDIAWVGYLLFFIGILFLTSVPSAYWAIIVLSSLCEFTISLLLILLVDRNGGPINLFKFVVLNQDYLSKGNKDNTSSSEEKIASNTTTTKASTSRTNNISRNTNGSHSEESKEIETKSVDVTSEESSTSFS